MGPDTESDMDRTYRKVLTKMPEGSQVLDSAYAAIQKVVDDFKKYVNVGAFVIHLKYYSLVLGTN